MTQNAIVQDSPMFRCGARCAERSASATASNVHDIIGTLGEIAKVDYVTYTRVSREWVKGYRTVNGNPEGRELKTAQNAWARLFKLAYGFSPSAVKPRSTSADAVRKAEARATAEPAEPKTVSFKASDIGKLSDIEKTLILALRAKGYADKDYATLLETLR
jgi:hypothetical protein